MKPFTDAELAAWATEVLEIDPREYELAPGEFTVNLLMQSYTPAISYSKARRVVDDLSAAGAIGKKKVRLNGRRTAVYWRLEE